MSMPRKAQVVRKSKETSIEASLNLDGGAVQIQIQSGFFSHMLTALATYAGWGLTLTAEGDIHIDDHHLVEDTGLVLGDALAQSLGDYSAHRRFASALVPMDEALAEVAIDLGRRPFLHFEVDWPQLTTGNFDLCLIVEFWRAFSQRAGATLHINGRYAKNSHHLSEAIFKAAGFSILNATMPRQGGVLSTKGML